MPLVLQMTRRLSVRPVPPDVPQVRLRPYAGPDDVELWLELRRRAFARAQVGISDWSAGDFQREFLDKPWWRPQFMWLAETQPLLMPVRAVGTVTLARRGEGPDAKPVVHWLCVVPGYRRRGLGRLLLAALETAVWDEGGRQVWLETHSGWREAFELYRSLGYEVVAS
jgi:ribosomal protein S18 acetylase RimI-like enzyme